MTSDYVSWVLGLQGWERAIGVDSYFAGEEDESHRYVSPNVHKRDETIQLRSKRTNSIGCQAGSSALTSEAGQAASKEVRQRAEGRSDVVEPGTTAPNPKICAATDLS